MFNSVDEALKIVTRLSRSNEINTVQYQAGIKYLKSKGYIMSGVGFNKDDSVWNYRQYQSRIYTLRSLNNQLNKDYAKAELMKGWKVSRFNVDLFNTLEITERMNTHLY